MCPRCSDVESWFRKNGGCLDNAEGVHDTGSVQTVDGIIHLKPECDRKGHRRVDKRWWWCCVCTFYLSIICNILYYSIVHRTVIDRFSVGEMRGLFHHHLVEFAVAHCCVAASTHITCGGNGIWSKRRRVLAGCNNTCCYRRCRSTSCTCAPPVETAKQTFRRSKRPSAPAFQRLVHCLTAQAVVHEVRVIARLHFAIISSHASICASSSSPVVMQ